MPYATAAQLASYVQSDVDTATAELLLDLASARIDAVAPVGMVIPSPPPADFLRICLQVAARAYANPLGLKSATLGPESVTYGAGVALTDDERADVVGLMAPTRPLVGTIHVGKASNRIRHAAGSTRSLDAESMLRRDPFLGDHYGTDVPC